MAQFDSYRHFAMRQNISAMIRPKYCSKNIVIGYNFIENKTLSRAGQNSIL